MKVLTFTSQKGGSGKTTLAGHIAVQAERTGAGPVAIIDADPQGNLTDWWNERKADTPAFARSVISELEQDIESLRSHGVRLVVIDTPPAIGDTISKVVSLSDLVAIPTRPSPHDLRAAGLTIEIVQKHGKPMVFVVNGATPRAKITGETAVVLSQHGTVAPVTIHQRTNFAVSMIDGRTVMELPQAVNSQKEIVALWSYLSQKLFGQENETTMPTSLSALGAGSNAQVAKAASG